MVQEGRERHISVESVAAFCFPPIAPLPLHSSAVALRTVVCTRWSWGDTHGFSRKVVVCLRRVLSRGASADSELCFASFGRDWLSGRRLLKALLYLEPETVEDPASERPRGWGRRRLRGGFGEDKGSEGLLHTPGTLECDTHGQVPYALSEELGGP